MATRILTLVVSVSMITSHQIGALVSTDRLLFNYNGSTLAECRFHLQIEFSPNCTKFCPPFAPFTFGNLCLRDCPHGFTAYSFSWCSKSRHPLPAVGRDKTPNLRCRKGFCPSERPFCLDYQCLNRCPPYTFNEDFSCVHTCSKLLPFISNDSCVMECPHDKPYNELGKCVSFCSSRLAKNDGTCVRNCPDNSKVYNNTCVDKCPSDSPFSIHVWNTSFCLDICPAFTVLRGENCNVGCPPRFDFLWNQTCVRDCPDSDPFIYVLTERLPFHKILVCLPRCPDNTFIDGKTCVKQCTSGMFVFNGSCVKSCPDSHPLQAERRNFENLKFTPSNFTMVTYSKHCVASCSDKEEYSRQFYRENLLFNGTCVSYCPDGLFSVNNTCVDECPTHYMFLHEGNCLSECPFGVFAFNGSCSHSCPSGMVAHNYKCVDQCPTSHSLQLNGNCVNHCPFFVDLFKSTCVDACPENAKYVFNRTCYSKCPSTHPYDYYNSCVRNCSFYYPARLYLGQTCVSKCPNYFAFDRSAESCVSKCPSTHPYNTSVNSGYFNPYSFECVLNCAETQVTYKYSCSQDCPEGTSRFKSDCLTQCPDSHPFNYAKEDQRGSFSYECLRECPGNTFIWKKNCFDKCPSPRPYSWSGICVEECPNTDRFIDHNTGRCLSQCSNNSVVRNTTCYNRCPENLPFIVNKHCTKSCPESMKFSTPTNKGQVCADRCLDQFVLFNESCIEKCPMGTIIIDNTCVDGDYCPSEYKYALSLPLGTVCYKRCPKGTFGDEGKCSDTCSGQKLQLASERTCVTQCPDTHSLTDNSTEAKCVASCREGLLEWTENKTCITSEICGTKQAFYNYNNEKCVRHCPVFSIPSFKGKQCNLLTKEYVIPFIVLLFIGVGALLFLYMFCSRKNKRPHTENDNDIEGNNQQREENLSKCDECGSSDGTILKSIEDKSTGSADNMQIQSQMSGTVQLDDKQTEELIDHSSSRDRRLSITSCGRETDETYVKLV